MFEIVSQMTLAIFLFSERNISNARCWHRLLMTSLVTLNVTSADVPSQDSKALLLLPYLGLAVACLVFLAGNFWCYHR